MNGSDFGRYLAFPRPVVAYAEKMPLYSFRHGPVSALNGQTRVQTSTVVTELVGVVVVVADVVGVDVVVTDVVGEVDVVAELVGEVVLVAEDVGVVVVAELVMVVVVIVVVAEDVFVVDVVNVVVADVVVAVVVVAVVVCVVGAQYSIPSGHTPPISSTQTTISFKGPWHVWKRRAHPGQSTAPGTALGQEHPESRLLQCSMPNNFWQKRDRHRWPLLEHRQPRDRRVQPRRRNGMSATFAVGQRALVEARVGTSIA